MFDFLKEDTRRVRASQNPFFWYSKARKQLAESELEFIQQFSEKHLAPALHLDLPPEINVERDLKYILRRNGNNYLKRI